MCCLSWIALIGAVRHSSTPALSGKLQLTHKVVHGINRAESDDFVKSFQRYKGKGTLEVVQDLRRAKQECFYAGQRVTFLGLLSAPLTGFTCKSESWGSDWRTCHSLLTTGRASCCSHAEGACSSPRRRSCSQVESACIDPGSKSRCSCITGACSNPSRVSCYTVEPVRCNPSRRCCCSSSAHVCHGRGSWHLLCFRRSARGGLWVCMH